MIETKTLRAFVRMQESKLRTKVYTKRFERLSAKDGIGKDPEISEDNTRFIYGITPLQSWRRRRQTSP